MALRPQKPCNAQGCNRLTRNPRYCDDHLHLLKSFTREKPRESSSARGYNYKWQQARAGYLATSGVLQTEQTLTDEAFARLKAEFQGEHMGVANAYKPMILEMGLDWKPISLNAQDTQFIESKKMSEAQICGLFRVPPHLVASMEKMTLNNIEHMGMSFVNYSLVPLMTRIEHRIQVGLLNETDRLTHYAKFNAGALMRGDLKGRYESYGTLDTKNDAERDFGVLQKIITGAAGQITGDNLIDLIHALKAGYRANGTWMMGNLTVAYMRKLKDKEGNYLWRPGLEAGAPSVLLGYGITENEDMPDVAADANAIAFGDFKRAYTIVDRIGTRVLRDPYTNKPYVGFYTTKRVGGMLVDSQAVKILTLSAE